jgi:threonine dehydratase
VSHVPQTMFIAASSGNFGQALAYACSLCGKKCIVVMPSTSAKVKINAVRNYGGQVDLIDVQQESRNERVDALAAKYPEAYIASAYDDPLIIEGNSSLGVEIGRATRTVDTVVVPVGGGGLISGIAVGLNQIDKKIAVIGAEPLIGNDAACSLRAGHIVTAESEPQTIADGARTLSVGRCNWEVIRKSVPTIVEVSEAHIAEALRLLFELANVKVEPTGALSVGAVLAHREMIPGTSICCVLSGANVDTKTYSDILCQ